MIALVIAFGILTLASAVLTVYFCGAEKEKPELFFLVLMILAGGVTMFLTTPGVN